MAVEKLNSGMERIYFRYILDNPNQFEKVDPSFFKNDDIRFVYNVIREEYLLSKNKNVPLPKQIFAMLKLRSDERVISKELLSKLLKVNDEYEKEWLEPRYKSWKLSNRLKSNIKTSIEYLREMDESNYDNVQDVASKLKNITNELDLIDDNEEDLGEDFDDPEAHRQDEEKYKIPSGWKSMDILMNGGWDYASLVVLLGETNVGKCLNPLSLLTLREKGTNKKIKMTIEDLFLIYKNKINNSYDGFTN